MSEMKIEITKRRDGTYGFIGGTSHHCLDHSVKQWQWKKIHEAIRNSTLGWLDPMRAIKEIMEAEVVVTEEVPILSLEQRLLMYAVSGVLTGCGNSYANTCIKEWLTGACEVGAYHGPTTGNVNELQDLWQAWLDRNGGLPDFSQVVVHEEKSELLEMLENGLQEIVDHHDVNNLKNWVEDAIALVKEKGL